MAHKNIVHIVGTGTIGEPLVGRLLTLDALGSRIHELKVQRDPSCPVCREGAQIQFIDYEQFCKKA